MTKKLMAMNAYRKAVQSGDLFAAQKILRLLINKQLKFCNGDTDWAAERYLNQQGLEESYTDRNGRYSKYYI